MLRLFASAALLLPLALAQAQTTIKITNPDATTCTYPTGQVSSNSTPGQLQATATATGSGNGCGTSAGAVSFGPASPLAPASQTLGNTGGAASVSFQVVNGNQCNGTITGLSGGTFASSGTSSATNLCSATGCIGTQTVSMNFPANTGSTDLANSLSITCQGLVSGSAISTASITVSHTVPTGTCKVINQSPSGTFTQLTGTPNVNYFSGGYKATDVTSFAAIYNGAWPGQYGLIADFFLPTNKYISAKFKVPDNYMTNAPANFYGKYSIGGTAYSAPMSFTISTSCGDFSDPAAVGSTVVSGCRANGVPTNGFIRWSNTGACTLASGTEYYLNIINANVANVTPTGGTATTLANAACSGNICSDPVQNGIGSWANYVP